MSKKTSSLAAAGIIAAAVILGGLSIYKDNQRNTDTDGTITLRMAQTSSQTGAIGQSMDLFAERIYEATNGKYKIETYHNGQLGAEIDTIEGCQMGTIDIAVVNQSTIGNFISDFQALDVPYLITSTEQADAVFMGDIGQRFLDKLSGVQLYGESGTYRILEGYGSRCHTNVLGRSIHSIAAGGAGRTGKSGNRYSYQQRGTG